jgi:hypothetical protein
MTYSNPEALEYLAHQRLADRLAEAENERLIRLLPRDEAAQPRNLTSLVALATALISVFGVSRQ